MINKNRSMNFIYLLELSTKKSMQIGVGTDTVETRDIY